MSPRRLGLAAPPLRHTMSQSLDRPNTTLSGQQQQYADVDYGWQQLTSNQACFRRNSRVRRNLNGVMIAYEKLGRSGKDDQVKVFVMKLAS
mmetsp:Transcript_5867/g.10167  ORF Transcript_5867/g.10167 Transcript_5867/m.10167 type:complete len:91 (-) Transcript_5867:78-350(-)